MLCTAAEAVGTPLAKLIPLDEQDEEIALTTMSQPPNFTCPENPLNSRSRIASTPPNTLAKAWSWTTRDEVYATSFKHN